MKKNHPLRKSLLFNAFLFLSLACFSQVSQQWIARHNGPANSSDMANAITLDAAGNAYVTGSVQVTATNSDYATIKYDANGNQLWVKTYNGTGNGGDGAKAIAVDAAGNVYVTGQSEGTGFFNFDYATVKYDANGSELWVKRYDGPGTATDIPAAIAVDAAGNVYVTGSSYGAFANTDYATIKYNNNGIEQWVNRYDGPGAGHDGANKLVIDGSGNVYITGYSTGSGTEEDYATIKYHTGGALQWVARYNGTANSLDQAFDLALDPAGNIFVTGQSFEPGGGSAYATVKYNTSGGQQWAARYHPGVGSDVAKALAVDATGNVYVTGQSNLSNSDFGDDFATIKYSTGGIQQWVARFDGEDHDIDQGNALALDAGGNLYVTGFSDNVGDLLTEGDYLTIKYNTNGIQQWVARYAGPGSNTDIATALAVDAAANVFVTGFSYGIGTEADYATIKYTQGVGCGNNGAKVMVCHNGKTLCLNADAVADHVKHGDQLGACASAAIYTSTKTKEATGSGNAIAGLQISHYPNPVTTAAKLRFSLPVDGQVSIRVFDALGRQVTAVADGSRKAGNYSSNLDASTLQNGVYYYRITLSTGNKRMVQTKIMTVVK